LQNIAGFILDISAEIILGQGRGADKQAQQYLAGSLQLDILTVKITKNADNGK
jgi:hypothetical protein